MSKEREICERRGAVLREKMTMASKAGDRQAFDAAFYTARRYMKKKELHEMMMMFIMDNYYGKTNY